MGLVYTLVFCDEGVFGLSQFSIRFKSNFLTHSLHAFVRTVRYDWPYKRSPSLTSQPFFSVALLSFLRPMN